ncbi:hypothetical protein JCM9743_34030 [Natrinema sp. JCM 9743]
MAVEEATEFAASIDTDTPQTALPASVETQIETQSKPYTAAAFFHFTATGSGADGPPVDERYTAAEAVAALRDAEFSIEHQAVRPEAFLMIATLE